jgi:hypothetical protein
VKSAFRFHRRCARGGQRHDWLAAVGSPEGGGAGGPLQDAASCRRGGANRGLAMHWITMTTGVVSRLIISINYYHLLRTIKLSILMRNSTFRWAFGQGSTPRHCVNFHALSFAATRSPHIEWYVQTTCCRLAAPPVGTCHGSFLSFWVGL